MEQELEEQEKHIHIKIFSSAPSLSNIEINKYFNYGPKFNGVFLRNNLPRTKEGAYVINLHDKKSKATRWVSLSIDRDTAVYFYSVGIEYIPQEVLSKIKDEAITRNIFRIQDDDFIMCNHCCIPFIEYMFAGKALLDYTNLFSPKIHLKNLIYSKKK